MKLIRNLKFLVVLLVILSVFTSKVKRTNTKNKARARLADMASVKSDCFEFGRSQSATISDIWLSLDTKSVKNGSSGLIVRNYYKSESFKCKFMTYLGLSDNKSKYFFSYRDFSNYDPSGQNNGFFYMRQLKIVMKDRVVYSFNAEKNLMFSDDISESELGELATSIKNNKNTYLLKYSNFVNQMRELKAKAEDLASTKAKNIQTRGELNTEIENKKAELTLTQETLKDLKEKASASGLQVRNLESEINKLKNDQLNPAIDSLKGYVQTLTGLTSQVSENNKKLQNIIPIDQSDLVESITKLKAKLTAFKGTYLDSDPSFTTLSTLIANIDDSNLFDGIPSLF